MSKNEVQNENSSAFESREDLKKLVFYIVIVGYGQGDNIIRILKQNHCSAAFLQMGEGTATSQIRDVLGIEDNRKEIVYSVLAEEYATDVQRELNAYFLAAKRNRGVGFSVKLDSIMGVKIYKFFTQTIKG